MGPVRQNGSGRGSVVGFPSISREDNIMIRDERTKSFLAYAMLGRDGYDWYDIARDETRDAAFALGCDYGTLCEVLAIMSPRVQVVRSIHMAAEYMITGIPPEGTMQSTLSALGNWERGGLIRGPKTSAFARALRGDDSAVVVDVWACRAMGIEHGSVGHAAGYRRAVAIVEQCSELTGLAPAQIQAAAWVGVIRAAGRTPAAFRAGQIVTRWLALNGERYKNGH